MEKLFVKNRAFLILLLSTALFGLCYYGKTHKPWLDLYTCMKNPEAYDGRLVTTFREPRIEKMTSDGFILRYSGGTIPVICDTTGLKENEYIGMTATFHKQEYLRAVRIIISKNRRFKILFSIAPVIIITGLFFYYFRINLKQKLIEMKHA